jgi:uncharacterized lipoprotein YmbA
MSYTDISYCRTALGILLLTAVILTTGCGRTSSINYYQLSAMVSDHITANTDEIGEAVIGIGPLRLPERLDRPQIITLLDANRLQVSDAHRWIEPLDENIARVLRENLSVLLDTEHFLLYPWSRTEQVDYQVFIDLIRFEGEGYQTVQLEAVWSIRDMEGKILLPRQRSSYQVKTSVTDHEGLVSAQSQTLAWFSSEIAQHLLLLAKKSSGEEK